MPVVYPSPVTTPSPVPAPAAPGPNVGPIPPSSGNPPGWNPNPPAGSPNPIYPNVIGQSGLLQPPTVQPHVPGTLTNPSVLTPMTKPKASVPYEVHAARLKQIHNEAATIIYTHLIQFPDDEVLGLELRKGMIVVVLSMNRKTFNRLDYDNKIFEKEGKRGKYVLNKLSVDWTRAKGKSHPAFERLITTCEPDPYSYNTSYNSHRLIEYAMQLSGMRLNFPIVQDDSLDFGKVHCTLHKM